MHLEVHKAPMHYIDGVPAYKTGEWLNHKSCKFGPTRMMVKQEPQQTFSFVQSKLFLYYFTN